MATLKLYRILQGGFHFESHRFLNMESASVEELSPLFFESFLKNDFDNCIDIGSFLELAVGLACDMPRN